MAKRATRLDVAELAGVSVATVSYVVNGGPRPVASETRERVNAAIEQLGYRPHAIARSLKTGKTYTVALLVANILHSFTAHLANAVEQSLADRNYSLILANSREDAERERSMLEVLSSQAIDGILCVPVSNQNDETIQDVAGAGIPVVFVDRYVPGVAADRVMTDNVEAVHTVVRHLLDLGRRNITYLSFSSQVTTALDRVSGFRKAYEAAGLSPGENSVLVVDVSRQESVQDKLIEHIRSYGRPDAVFCSTGDFVVPAIRTLKQQGFRVPEEVIVAGEFVETPWMELYEPPVPAFYQNPEVIGQQAVAFLMDRLDGYSGPARRELVSAQFNFGDR